jgi:hypothetical protein
MTEPERFFAVTGEAYVCDGCQQAQATIYEVQPASAVRGLCARCTGAECESLSGLGRALVAARARIVGVRFPAGASGDYWSVLRNPGPCDQCQATAMVVRRSHSGRRRLRLCHDCAAAGAERAVELEIVLTRACAELRAEEIACLAEAGRVLWGVPLLDDAGEEMP